MKYQPWGNGEGTGTLLGCLGRVDFAHAPDQILAVNAQITAFTTRRPVLHKFCINQNIVRYGDVVSIAWRVGEIVVAAGTVTRDGRTPA